MKLSHGLLMGSIMLIALAGCAAGPNELADTPDEEGRLRASGKACGTV